MSLWDRIQELVVEIGLRLVKVVVASLLGLVVYVVLTGPFGVPPSSQVALESWIAGLLVFLILETGHFLGRRRRQARTRRRGSAAP